MRFPTSMEVSKSEVTQCGPLLEGLHPVVPDNGWHNTVAAFRKRCNYFSAKRATPAIISSAMALVDVICPVHLEKFEWTDSLYQAWVTKFGKEKQARMENALANMLSSTKNDYTKKDIFVKVEALLVTHKPNWAPRVIFKGTDVYNAVSGPVFGELMRRFDHCLEGMKGPYRFHTAYRKTPCQYTPHLEIDGKHQFILEADFSSNDKFQCSDVQLLEVAMMRALGCPEWFVRLHLKTNFYTVSNQKHGIKASLAYQLPTGATDTTFRNTFWNACILYSFLVRVKAEACQAMLLGDDMLAKISGFVPYAVKTYASIASEAQMEAKVIRHDRLWTASFLSRFFVPYDGVKHLTVPILGKTLGRFNMRANNNKAVSDHSYMAGKAVGYAYEYRYYPTIRNIFLERFKYEYAFASSERKGANFEVEVSWNAKQAGVTLSNITKKLVVEEYLSDDDFNSFCLERYSLTARDVICLFEKVVLANQAEDLGGIVVQTLAKDFL